MVSKEVRALEERRKKYGGNFGTQRDWARKVAERDKRKEEIAKRQKEATKNERQKRAEAILVSGLKVGDRVTDGRNTGKIVSFDPITKSAIVRVGRKEIPISPSVLKIA